MPEIEKKTPVKTVTPQWLLNAAKFSFQFDISRRPSPVPPWEKTLLPIFLAALVSVALVALAWLIRPSLSNYFLESLGLFIAVLAGVAIFVRSFLPLPKNWGWATLAVIGYAWPFQWACLWRSFQLPVNEFVLVFFGTSTLGLLLILGTKYLVEHAPPGRKGVVAYCLLCLFLGCAGAVLSAPGLVLVDGLRNLAQFPQIREAVNQKGEFPSTPTPADIEFVHLSDLHLTGSVDENTIEGNPSGDGFLPSYVEQVAKLGPRMTLISGDMTDGGDLHQWRAVSAALQPLGRKTKIICAPGNHDLSTAYSREPESRANSEPARLAWFLHLQALLDQDRPDLPPVMTTQGVALQKAVQALGGPGNPFLKSEPRAAEAPAGRPDRATFADDYFPLQWHSPDGKSHVYILNSTTHPRSHLGTSAVGSFGDWQLGRLKKHVEHDSAQKSTQCIIFLFHHPIARPPVVERAATLFGYGTLALDPADSQTMFHYLWGWQQAMPSKSWIVCYGHRHERHYGMADGLHVVEAPNLTPDVNERGVWTGYLVDGRIQIGWTPVTMVRK